MVRLSFATISMDPRIFLREPMISVMDSMIQPKELFANMTVSSNVIWSQVKNSGPQKNVDTMLGSLMTMVISTALKTRSSRR